MSTHRTLPLIVSVVLLTPSLAAEPRMSARAPDHAPLLDGRRTVFLHDASVTGGLDELLDPKRGAESPRPFYFEDKTERAAVFGFLRSLDTGANKTASAQR